MIFLASPYSHPEERIRVRRFLAARDFLFLELAKGQAIFSPIVYGHQFARDYSAPTDADSWAHLNNEILLRSSALWILDLEGWETSIGVAAEIALAESLSLPILHKEPIKYATL